MKLSFTVLDVLDSTAKWSVDQAEETLITMMFRIK